MKRKMPMTAKMVLAMILGIIAGILLQEHAEKIKFLGDIFLRLIQMGVVLLVMGQIIEAIGSIQPKTVGKIGAKTIFVFISSSLLAAVYGVIVGIIGKPGENVQVTEVGLGIKTPRIQSLQQVIVDFFPTNIMDSLASGSIVQVIVFSIVFGLALSYVIKKSENDMLLLGITQFNQVIIRMVTLIMNIAPIGIFALIASTVGQLGIKVIYSLGKYLIIYGLCTISFLLLWFIFVAIYCKISMKKLIKKMTQMSVVALATTSSAVTLPTAIKDSEEKLGIHERISHLVLPLGMSLNSNGSAMHMAITIITIAQIYNIHYQPSEYLYIAVLATLASLANAVVPGAGLVSLTIVIPQMGLPIESVAMFAGIEWFVGMLRTILNVDSDALSALIVARSENAIDKRKWI